MTKYDVEIVGAGAAGIATEASLKKRKRNLNILLIDSAVNHGYQPGWTLAGARIFKPEVTQKEMADIIPPGVTWKRAYAASFSPESLAQKSLNRLWL